MGRVSKIDNRVLGTGSLPRLLYIGDVTIESTAGGSVALYRLLQRYPADRLRIVHGSWRLCGKRVLPRVRYETVRVGITRLLRTRLFGPYLKWLWLTSGFRSWRLDPWFMDFRPEGILTCAFGYLWLAAAAAARRHGVPLHLVVYDDPLEGAGRSKWLRAQMEASLGHVYRSAASRLCVSAPMEAHYRERYGIGGTILYPCRDADAREFSAPPKPVPGRPFTVAFVGSLWIQGYSEMVAALAGALESFGGKLLIFSTMSEGEVARLVGDRRNVTKRPFVASSDELIEVLRAEADALFVPMSFTGENRLNMEISFPSKLADCTAAGLPILIWGPPYCSAIRWALENGVARVVTSANAAEIGVAMRELAENMGHRLELGERALSAGKRFFSHAVATTGFYDALVSARVRR